MKKNLLLIICLLGTQIVKAQSENLEYPIQSTTTPLTYLILVIAGLIILFFR